MMPQQQIRPNVVNPAMNVRPPRQQPQPVPTGVAGGPGRPQQVNYANMAAKPRAVSSFFPDLSVNWQI